MVMQIEEAEQAEDDDDSGSDTGKHQLQINIMQESSAETKVTPPAVR